MEIFEKIKFLLKKPEIKLLTSNNADFVLSFLYSEFKINEKDKIAKSELHYDLRYFISQLPNSEFGYQDAKYYISEWQTTDKPFLKTLYFDQEEKEYIILGVFIFSSILLMPFLLILRVILFCFV